MPTFDLRHESWIPVRMLDGRSTDIGLKEALVRAHEIRELDLDNPMEAAALYRLLLALAVRIHSETFDEDAWFDLRDDGHFNEQSVVAYLDRFGDRFDLFHAEHPFYQVRRNTGNSLLQPSYLRLHEGGNTSSLFSHDDLTRNEAMAPAMAARGVVASQHAAIGGLLSNPYKTGNKNSPAVGGAIFWLHGTSLFQSLMLNAPPSDETRMGGLRDGDAPAWEVEPSRERTVRAHRGFLDYLTYQHRRLTLEFSVVDGVTLVNGFRRTGGDILEEPPLDDPHMAILAPDAERKLPPRRYNIVVDRAVWRDSSIFMTLESARGKPPRTFDWLRSNRDILGMDRIEIELFGLRTRGANDGTIRIWRSERLPLFLTLLSDPDRGRQIVVALDAADQQGRTLRHATETAARGMLSKGSDAVKPLAEAMSVSARYWAKLETPYNDLVRGLAEAPAPTGDPDWATPSMSAWYRTLHRAALDAFDAATASFVGSARQLKAITEARAMIGAAGPYDVPRTNHITVSSDG
jgi:CRISPR system Cascade subunit CasA